MKLISQERFALSLVFKLRVFGTRKWPIKTRSIHQKMKLINTTDWIVRSNLYILWPSSFCSAVELKPYPGYHRFFSRAAGIFGVGRRPRPRAETRNRARKFSVTQGSKTWNLANVFLLSLVDIWYIPAKSSSFIYLKASSLWMLYPKLRSSGKKLDIGILPVPRLSYMENASSNTRGEEVQYVMVTGLSGVQFGL